MHRCTGILGKQWFLRDIPYVARIVGRYEKLIMYGEIHTYVLIFL